MSFNINLLMIIRVFLTESLIIIAPKVKHMSSQYRELFTQQISCEILWFMEYLKKLF